MVVSAFTHARAMVHRGYPIWKPLVFLLATMVTMNYMTTLVTKSIFVNLLRLPDHMSAGSFMILCEMVMAFFSVAALGIATYEKDGGFFARTAYVTDVHHSRFFTKGLVIGAVCLSIPVMLMWLCGWYHASLSSFHDIFVSLLEGTICMFFVAVFEETMFRGIFFEFVEQSFGTWAALAITSTCFGVMHLANPKATAFGAICIAVEAGLMIGGALVYSRSMWMPIGIHMAWNLFQGSVWGLAVSGCPKPERAVFDSSVTGGPWYLTGGDFGPEGSLFSLIVCSAMGLYLIRYAYYDNQFMLPSWMTQEWRTAQLESDIMEAEDDEEAIRQMANEKAPLLSN